MASTYELIIKAVDQTSGPLSRIERNLKRLDRASKSTDLSSVAGKKTAAGAGLVAGAISKIPGPLVAISAAAAGAALGMAAIVNATKEFQRVENGLRLITNSTAELNQKTALLRDIALETRTSFGATADLYTKLTIASDELGVSSADVAKVTTNLSKALAVAGADGATTSSVIRQFGQAMASGTVRGDEFNSLVEGLGPALSIMAKETGINVGKLREMSQNGELTAEVMFKMLKNTTALTEAFNKMAPSIDSLETALGDTFDRFLVNIGKTTGLTDAYQQSLINLTEVLGRFNKKVENANDPLTRTARNIIAQKEIVDDLKNASKAYIAVQELLTNGEYDHAAAVKEAEKGLSLLIEKYKSLKNETNKTAESTKKVTNALQPLMTSAEKVADSFKSYGALTGMDKLKSDLLQLENAMANYTAASNAGAASNSNTFRILGQSIAGVKKQIADLEKAEADKVTARLDAETKKLATTVNSLTGEYGSLINADTQLLNKYNEYSEALKQVNTLLSTNKNLTAQQKTELEQLATALTSAREKQGGFLKSGITVGETLNKTSAALKQNTLDYQDLTNAIKQLEQQKGTQFDDESLTANLVALNAKLKENREQRNDLLGIVKEEETVSQKLVKSYQEEAKELNQLNIALKNVSALSIEAGVSQEFLTGKILAMIEANELSKKSALTTAQIIDEGFKKAVQSLPKELSSAIVKGENLFKTLENSFNRLLDNILQQILESQIQSALTELFTPKSGGSGGGLTSMLSAAASYLFGAPGKAVGGPVAAGQPYVVGERGPEMFMPNTAGSIVSNSELNSGGGGAVINFNINSIDTQTGVEFLLENKKNIIGMVSQGFNQRGRQGITS